MIQIDDGWQHPHLFAACMLEKEEVHATCTGDSENASSNEQQANDSLQPLPP